MFRNTQRRPVETFIVGSADSALTNVANPGEHITVSADGSINAASGQIGLVSSNGMGSIGINILTDATPTIAEAPVVYLIQGTAASANPAAATAAYPLAVRPYERTQDINSANYLYVTKQAAVSPTHSIFFIGGDNGGADAIVATDETTYELEIAFRGRIFNELYSPEATNSFSPKFTTPNYTALGTAEPVDHLIQNLTYNINLNSYATHMPSSLYVGGLPIVALALDETAGQGTDTSTLTAGTILPVVTTSLGTRSITLTAAQAASIIAAVSAAGWAADTSILNINLTTAGTVTNGVAEGILLMGLDRVLAYEDRIPQVKTRLQVGLTAGFDPNLVYNEEVSFANEGQGQGRVLDLWYKATHGQRKYNLDHTLDPVIEYASPINTSLTYAQYTIHHVDANQIDSFNVINSPMKEIVLFPTTATTAIASFDTVFGAWVTSANGAGIVTI